MSATLVEVLRRRLEEDPDRTACWLVGPDGRSQPVTWRRLMARAGDWARAFGKPPPGPDRPIAAICSYPGPDLHAAFLGALWSGWIPAFLAPPSPRMDRVKFEASFRAILRHVRPACLVLDAASAERLGPALADPGGARILGSAGVPAQGGPMPEPWPATPGDIAVLQHSSGTTGLQKGVALSHRAILAHHHAYAKVLGIGAQDCVATWLPLYHDMGLMACFLMPLIEGVPFVEIPTFDWVLRPWSLMEKIQEHRATLCWLPNFAFALLARTARDRGVTPGLDVSSVRAWISCSEFVMASSQRAFLDAYGPSGVSQDRLSASYAMAETVFAATQARPGSRRVLRVDRRALDTELRIAEPSTGPSIDLVSSGPVLPTLIIEVRDPAGRALPQGHLGEIHLRGEHLFSGYFRRPDLTAEAMTPDGSYRTGDLGLLQDGEVYVTGRLKDLVIIQGRNLHPSDIEAAAASAPGVIPGRVAAIGIADEESGSERLVILAEAEPGSVGVEMGIRRALVREMDLSAGEVRLVPERWLVKSTSGKMARADIRRKWLAERTGGRAHP